MGGVRPALVTALSALALTTVGAAGSPRRTEIVYRNDHPCQGNSCGKAEIYAIGANGKGRRRLTTNKVDDLEPALSPDGKRIVIVRVSPTGNSDLWVMRRDGSGQRRLTYTPTGETEPDWAPDGKRIVFRSFGDNQNFELFTIPARGGKPAQLTHTAANEVNPAWSPDGNRIAFQSNGTKIEIAVLDLRTNKTKTIAEGFSPSWSPDGRRIAYAASHEGQFELFVIGARGGRAEQVTTTGGEEPSWSRDGRKLAFDWDGQLFTVNVDGTARRQVTRPGSGLNVEPDW